MSRKKKIILSILSTITLFVFYNVWDWETNRHWIGTTKETEIVQQHLLPMEEYFPEGDWYVMCGDSPEDYFLVWIDFGLFGTHPTLGSGSCWMSSNIWLDNPEQYVDAKIIPWLKNQGFTDITIKKHDENDPYSPSSPGEMYVNTSPHLQKLADEKGKLKTSLIINIKDGSNYYNPSTKFYIYFDISYFYIAP